MNKFKNEGRAKLRYLVPFKWEIIQIRILKSFGESQRPALRGFLFKYSKILMKFFLSSPHPHLPLPPSLSLSLLALSNAFLLGKTFFALGLYCDLWENINFPVAERLENSIQTSSLLSNQDIEIWEKRRKRKNREGRKEGRGGEGRGGGDERRKTKGLKQFWFGGTLDHPIKLILESRFCRKTLIK